MVFKEVFKGQNSCNILRKKGCNKVNILNWSVTEMFHLSHECYLECYSKNALNTALFDICKHCNILLL